MKVRKLKNNRNEFIGSKTWLVNLFLLISDLLGFAISFGLITLVRKLILHVEDPLLFDPQVLRTLLMLAGLSIFMFMVKGLYPGRGRISVIELKEITEALFAAYAIVSVYIFINSRSYDFSRSIYLLSGIFEIGIITIGRILVRKMIVSVFSWWGEPVAIIGSYDEIKSIIRKLLNCRRLGYRPAIGLSIDKSMPSNEFSGVCIQSWSPAEQERISKGINTVILAIPTTELRKSYPLIYHSVGLKFRRTIFILDNDIYGSMMAQPIDLNGQPAVISHQSLFNTSLRIVKWSFEILACVLLVIPFLILSLIIAILIKIDSDGPVFHYQERVGKDLKPYKLLKFRTMYLDSDKILSQMLLEPKLSKEWEKFHKFKDDPRVTRVGRWIRKYSLDELPQFINILRGEMSLIGPRPLVQAEIDKMGELANIVFKVRPGLTGWWQVNGRNNLSFEERTQLDVYYVFNWSLWLDAYIVIKTFWVIFFDRDGR